MASLRGYFILIVYDDYGKMSMKISGKTMRMLVEYENP
jgi:hypothetical protein